MRLWSIHPSYLDARGLVALWREGLLAQKVLAGKTSGYKNHPQLERFKAARSAQAAISRYLLVVYAEAAGRGYHFCKSKIGVSPSRVPAIKVTRGQLAFEFGHLLKKLKKRARGRYNSLRAEKKYRAHPLFSVVAGPVAPWEIRMKKSLIYAFIFLVLIPSVSSGQEASIEEKLKRLEDRVQLLEKKVMEQDQCMLDQKQCIARQQEKIAQYESRLSQLDERSRKWQGPDTFVSDGFKIGAWATAVVQGTNNTNATDTKKESRLDGSYTADITVEKEFREVGGLAYIHLSAGKSEGLNNDLRLYSNVNDDALDREDVRVTEFYYEQKLFKDTGVLTFGKLDPLSFFDNNTIANDETSQFLAHMFVNNPAIDFPDNGAGIRAGYLPREWVELGFGVFDADGDWEKLGDNLFTIGEVNIKPRLFGQEGNYRFIAWHNDAPHTKWLDPEKDKKDSYGFALSFDQKVTDIVTLFCRYGGQSPRVYNPENTATPDVNFSLVQAWSAGAQLAGKPWGRENDVLGVAVGENIPSPEYKEAGAGLEPALLAKREGRLEAYYCIQVNKYLSISPDFQYIWNPFGRDVRGDADNIFVYGFRTQVDF